MKRIGHPHMGRFDGKYKQNGKTTRARTSSAATSIVWAKRDSTRMF
jgi:hypothetical protein